MAVVASGDAILGITIQVSSFGSILDDPAYTLTVTRVDDDGHYDNSVVRGASEVAITDDTMTFYDFEAPFNTQISYTTTVFEDGVEWGTMGDSNALTTTVPSGFTVITDVLTPANRVSGGILDLSSWQRQSQILGSHRVLGRAAPVVATDVLSSRSGTLVASNLNLFDVNYDGYGPYDLYEAVEGDWPTLFDSGTIMLFRNDWSVSGFDDMYFIVDGVETTRASGIVGAVVPPIKSYSINFMEVERPSPTTEAPPLFTWQDVLDNYATWADVQNAFTTWQEVLDNPIP